MTGFSKLLMISSSSSNMLTQLPKQSSLFTSLCLRNATQKNTSSSLLFKQQIRGSHGRSLFIRPGLFYTKKFWDIVHFYLGIAVVPLGLFVLYENIVVGPATLAEIPEGYEPRTWEYIKHPVRRFMQKHFYQPPERMYELTLHTIYQEQCSIKMRKLEKKVKSLVKERQDYKAWYYVPEPKEQLEYAREFQLQNELKGLSENRGGAK